MFRRLLLILFLGLGTAQAQENLDDLLQGFDDSKPAKQSVDDLMQGFDDQNATTQAANSGDSDSLKWLSIGGYSSLSESINYQHSAPAPGEADFRGLSRLRLKLSPELKVDLPQRWKLFVSGSGFFDGAFYANGREQYRDSYLDAYEKELELRELWLSGTLGQSLDIKLGRQIVAWGKSDTIRVVDVLNPLDMREPGMVDIEDLRLPVTMLKADYYFGDWSLTAIAIPELRHNRIPAQGSDFYPVPFPLPPEDAPENWKNPEYAAALSGVFSGWDLSLHAASTYEDQPHFKKTSNGMQRAYARVNMLGVAENMAFGSWLLKFEYAYFDGMKYFATGDKTFSRTDLLLGVDYSGITDHTLSLEGLWSYILNYDDALEQIPDDLNEHSGQIAIRYTGNFLRETVQVVALASIFGLDGNEGGFYRGSVKYNQGDGLSVTAGIMIYQSGDSMFLHAIAANDRVFAEVRYDF